MAGVTSSTTFLTTPGAFDTTSNGGDDIFVFKIFDQPPNQPPLVVSDSPTVTVNEGATAGNTGTYSDPNSGDNVTISVSVGSVTKSGTDTGTWSWSFVTTDGPAQSQTVTITADDGKGGIATTTFALTVNNVAPSVSFNLSANPVSENSSVSLSGSISDPGIVDSHTVVIDWGDGSSTTGLTLTPGVLAFSASHPYLDDNPSGTPSDVYPISVTVTDKDSGTGSAGTGLSVRNVAPVINTVAGPTSPLPLGNHGGSVGQLY